MRLTMHSLVLLLVLALAPSARAAIIPQAGDFSTVTQVRWGDPGSAPAQLLVAHYDFVYGSTGGVLELGIPGPTGFSILFTGASPLINFLPTANAVIPLNADLVDPGPNNTSALWGEVAALALNVDFSDGGHLVRLATVAFGDLFLTNFVDGLAPANGLTVRDFLGVANTVLGGSSASLTALQVFDIIQQLNSSFVPGITPWAQDHLRIPEIVAPIPEPSSLALLATGILAVLTGTRRRVIRV